MDFTILRDPLPTRVSMLFFGVPFLLEELGNAGMGEK